MLAGVDDVLKIAEQIFRADEMPKEFRLLDVPRLLAAGQAEQDLKRALRTTTARLREIATAPDPLPAVLRTTLAEVAQEKPLKKARQSLGQMLLGTLCERAFEDFYRQTMGTTELRLEDTREGQTDTDYRVFNGSNRPVFRINIKFHGSPFRNARELVDLDPEDCFALATYKIHGAIKKQEAEFLPYIFVVLGVPGLRGEVVGDAIPPTIAHFASLVLEGKIPRKRAIEDLIVRHLVDDPQASAVKAAIDGFATQIRAAPWRVLSARRADQLVHDLLFQRVYALRVRGFASHYGRAEVDMHFSISNDLRTLEDFLGLLRDHGVHGLVARLERGDI